MRPAALYALAFPAECGGSAVPERGLQAIGSAPTLKPAVYRIRLPQIDISVASRSCRRWMSSGPSAGAGHHDHIHEFVLPGHHAAIHVLDLLQADVTEAARASTDQGLCGLRKLVRGSGWPHDQRERHAAIGRRQHWRPARQRLKIDCAYAARRVRSRRPAFGALCAAASRRQCCASRASGRRGAGTPPRRLHDANIGFDHIERQADQINPGRADRLDRLLHLQQQRRFLPLRLREIRQHAGRMTLM
jgi:hypothetical protein